MKSANDAEIDRLLADIVHWGERLFQHTSALTYAQFSIDQSRVDAVCWCISCIGEAAGKIRQISPEFAAQNTDLELSNAYAMRNRITHGYQALDLDLIWETVNRSIPRLVKAASTKLGTA
jgi:uncharacterized protein with HEPN domain